MREDQQRQGEKRGRGDVPGKNCAEGVNCGEGFARERSRDSWAMGFGYGECSGGWVGGLFAWDWDVRFDEGGVF